MIKCKNCGQMDFGNNFFCTNCGHSLASGEFVPPAPHVWKSTDEFNKSEDKPLETMSPDAPRMTIPEAGPVIPAQFNSPQLSIPFTICPYCKKQILPLIEKQISPIGWATFVVMFFLCLPLFWVGFLIKEEVKRCPYCQLKLP